MFTRRPKVRMRASGRLDRLRGRTGTARGAACIVAVVVATSWTRTRHRGRSEVLPVKTPSLVSVAPRLCSMAVLASSAWPLSVARKPSAEMSGKTATYEASAGRSFFFLEEGSTDVSPSPPPISRSRNCVSGGMESHSLAPHVGVIHHSLHRALAMNRLVVGRREAICTTWREMGSARCAPEGPTAFSPRLSTPTCTGSKSRTSSPVHSERTRSSRTVSSSNLGETPSKIARLPTRSTPSCNNNPAIAAPLPLASRFPPRAIAPAGLDRCARSKASDGFTPAPRERENGLSADAPRRNDPSLGTSDRPKISHLSSQSCSPVQSASNETDFAHRSRTDVSRSFSSLTVFLRSPRAR